MIAGLLREDRLAVWDRLVRGEHVPSEDVSGFILRLSHDAPPEEKASCVLLLASLRIANEGRRAMRRNLRAALRYWFSHSGSNDRPVKLNPRDLQDAGLERLVGLYLSWPEAMKSVRGNPEDYTALKRVEKQLRAQCAVEWQEQFGSGVPAELSARR